MSLALMPPRQSARPHGPSAAGSQLRALREAAGKTQVEVGERLGIDSRTVSAYERGRATIRVKDIGRWAEALGVSVAELTHRLGLGAPPEEMSHLRAELAAAMGPDNAELLDEVFDEIAPLPREEQRYLIEMWRAQVFNRPPWPGR